MIVPTTSKLFSATSESEDEVVRPKKKRTLVKSRSVSEDSDDFDADDLEQALDSDSSSHYTPVKKSAKAKRSLPIENKTV